MSSKRRRSLAVAAIALGTLVASSSAPEAAELSAFEGQWKGTALEGSSAANLAAAAFELEIKPVRGSGVAARWTLPSLPKSGALPTQIDARFAETGDGVFSVEPPEPSLIERVFARPATGNPLSGETLLWGRLEGDQLILYSLSIAEHGHPALIRSAYRRDGNSLEFERNVRIGVDEPLVIRGRLGRGGS